MKINKKELAQVFADAALTAPEIAEGTITIHCQGTEFWVTNCRSTLEALARKAAKIPSSNAAIPLRPGKNWAYTSAWIRTPLPVKYA